MKQANLIQVRNGIDVIVSTFEASNKQEALNIGVQRIENCGFIGRVYIQYNGQFIF